MQRMRLFHEIPADHPAMPLLARIDAPNDLRQLNREQLQTVADELREYLLYP
jgi:Deoxyxylulose-5-phosphate synthase